MKPIKQGDSYLPNLPNVAGHQLIDAAHINRLSKAVGKYSILSAVGAQVKRTERGSSIVVPLPKEKSHPFQVWVTSTHVIMRSGYVFAGGGNMPSIISNTYGASINLSEGLDGQYKEDGDESYFVWEHQDKTKEYIVSILVDGINNAYVNYRQVLQSQSTPDGWVFEYPIATIKPLNPSNADSDCFLVKQIIDSHIYSFVNSHAFKVTCFTLPTYGEDEQGNTTNGPEEVRAMVSFGQVNGITPQYKLGGIVGDGVSSVSIGTEIESIKYIYLEITGEPKPQDFPTSVKVDVGDTIPEPDSNKVCIGIASVRTFRIDQNPNSAAYNKKGVSIQQGLRNGVWGSSHRIVPNKVEYYFTST